MENDNRDDNRDDESSSDSLSNFKEECGIDSLCASRSPVCSLCLKPAKDSYQAKCGHLFCKECIQQWIKNNGGLCPEDGCPLTWEDLEEGEGYDDAAEDRLEMAKRDIKCLNYVFGCGAVIQVNKFEDHVKDCPYEQVSCLHCDEILSRRDLSEHIRAACKNRPVQCSICKQFQPFKDLENHQLTNCPHASCVCAHCSATLERYEMVRHLSKDCQEAPVTCCFSEFGCNERVKRRDLLEHLETKKDVHNAMVCETVNKLVMKGMEGARPGNSRRSSCEAAGSSSLLWTTSIDRKDPFPPDCGSGANFHNESTSGHIDELFSRIVCLEQKNLHVEFEMKEMSKRMLDKERELEARFCFGTFKWTVDNFSLLKTEALNGNPKVIHSPSFYTSPCGYKVCLRVNFQITKMQRDDATISMFVHFMAGEYDDDLVWPFMGFITISIVNPVQPDLSISYSMKSDPEKAAFQRVLFDSNVPRNVKGFGYGEFTSADKLEMGNYIVDDKMIVKVVIEARHDKG